MTPTDEDMKVARDVCKELAPFLRFAHCWLWLDPAAEEVIARALASQRELSAQIAETKYADPAWHMYYQCAGDVIAAAIRAGKKG